MPFQTPDYAGMAVNAFDQGRLHARQKGVQNALAMYAKDPAASQSALVGMGAFDEAKQIGDARQQTTREQVGTQAAAGDMAGAQKTAMGAGQFDTVAELAKLGEQQRQQAIGNITQSAQIGNALAAAFPIDPANPQAALDARKQRAMQLAPQLGIDPKQIEGLDFSDAAIQQHVAEAQKLASVTPEKWQSINLGNGGVARMGEQSGQLDILRQPDQPIQYQDVAGGDGSHSLLALPKYATQGAQGGDVGQGGFDNIYQRFTAPHEGGYAPQDGNGQPVNFGINQGANPDVNVKDLTPEAAAKIMYDRYWAPSGADSLPPALQAIQFDTAVNMGVGAAKDLLNKSGGDPQKYLQLREAKFRAIAANDPSKAASLPTWLQRNQDLAAYVGGGQQSGGQGAPKVIYQSAAKPDAGAVASQDVNPNGLTGADYLATLSPSDAAAVKALAEGRKAFPTGSAQKDPNLQRLLSMAQAYDPSLDESNYHARAAIRKAFTSGAQSKNITSFNTALAHAGALANSIHNLYNWDAPLSGGDQGLNALRNVVEPSLAPGGNRAQALRKYHDDVNALASELTTAFRGTGGAEADVKSWRAGMKDTDATQTQMAGLSEAVKLLHGRIEALQDSYDRGQTGWLNVADFLSPSAKRTLAKFQDGGQGGDVSAPAQAATQPDSFKVGQTYTDASGNKATYRGNGQWEEH